MADLGEVLRRRCRDVDERVLVEFVGHEPGGVRRRAVHSLVVASLVAATVVGITELAGGTLWWFGLGALSAGHAVVAAWYRGWTPARRPGDTRRGLVVSTHRVVTGEIRGRRSSPSISEYPVSSGIELVVSTDAPSWSSGGAALVEVVRASAPTFSISLDGVRPEAVRRALGHDPEADGVVYSGEEVRGYWAIGWAAVFALFLVAVVAIAVATDDTGLARAVGLNLPGFRRGSGY